MSNSDSVRFKCRCSGFEIEGYSSTWRKHLWSSRHQREARDRLQTTELEEDEKKLLAVVFGLHSIPMKQVLHYFFEHSIITDFIFWADRPDFCVIEFISKKHRNVVASQAHTILKYPVLLRLMDGIPELEWLSICPTFQKPAVSARDTDSSNSSWPLPSPYNAPRTPNPMTPSPKLPKTPSPVEKGEAFETESDTSSSTSSSSNTNGAPLSDHGSSCGDSEDDAEGKDKDDDGTDDDGANDEGMDDAGSSNNDLSDDDVEIIGETSKNANAPLIDLDNDNDDQEDLTNEDMLENQMTKLYEAYRMGVDQWDFRTSAKMNVEFYLRRVMPECRLIPFLRGSSSLGSVQDTLHLYYDRLGILATPDSEGDRRQRPTSSTASSRQWTMDLSEFEITIYAQRTVDSLKTAGDHSSNSFIITKAEHQEGVVSFKYTESLLSVPCKIHFGDLEDVQACRLVKFYIQLDERVRPLLAIVQHWSIHRTWFGGKEGINYSAMQWLVIFYLMEKKILPSVLQLQQLPREVDLRLEGRSIGFSSILKDVMKIMKGVNRCYEKNSSCNPSALTMCKLTHGMFQFFSSFNFEAFAVIPSFGWKAARQLPLDEAMVLQHPFSEKNMTQNVATKNMRAFRNSCTLMYLSFSRVIADAESNSRCSLSAKNTANIMRILQGASDGPEQNIRKRKRCNLSSSSSSSSSESSSSPASNQSESESDSEKYEKT